MVEAFIASEKVTSTLVAGATPVALFAGATVVTVGGVVSPVEGGGLAALLTPWLSRSKESAKTIAVSTDVDVLYVRNRANLLLELIPIHPSL
jgi:hypothetical protein